MQCSGEVHQVHVKSEGVPCVAADHCAAGAAGNQGFQLSGDYGAEAYLAAPDGLGSGQFQGQQMPQCSLIVTNAIPMQHLAIASPAASWRQHSGSSDAPGSFGEQREMADSHSSLQAGASICSMWE